ncbi:hypothetical protein EWB00_010330 [Schistosoma japonicum]|uniref:Uncharacterized protein n=1 Tax=Schistosoma japonicum TaxID=6182 RepID=A0A4Z2DP22_SCHJA|nr:hypothetical protein EWB00_010330 [Schistosoma japonicum]
MTIDILLVIVRYINCNNKARTVVIWYSPSDKWDRMGLLMNFMNHFTTNPPPTMSRHAHNHRRMKNMMPISI